MQAVHGRDLIYRDEAVKNLTGWETDPTDEEIVSAINSISAVDAVQVVRCRDCKYYDVEPGGDVMMCYEGLGWTQPDDYCSTGERKKEEQYA